MIINLIGPPCAGKSTFAARYILEHPFFTYVSIDAYRIEFEEEEEAWAELAKALETSKDVILETSGLSWRLPAILEKVKASNHILTIALVADKDALHDRLNKREHKRPIPYRYSRLDEHDAVDWVLQNLENCSYPIDLYVRTDDKSKDQIYNLLSEKILSRRLDNS